jgi:hypothetical protein
MIARPTPDVHGEILELSAPALVLDPDSPRTDHEDGSPGTTVVP